MDVEGNPQLARCLSDTLKPLFQQVNLRQLPVFDRMVFDINRRAILERTRTRPLSKERKQSSGEVFSRLIEDTTKRMSAKKPIKDTISSPIVLNDNVYLRLHEDARARRQSSIIRMRMKEESEKPAKPTSKPVPTDPIRLVNRLMEDADIRRRKAEECRREKETKEAEEAKRLAEMHHPKRKPDENILRRLLAPHRRAKTGEWSRHSGQTDAQSLSNVQPELSLPSPSKPSDSSSPTCPVPAVWAQTPFYFHIEHPVLDKSRREQQRGKAAAN